MFLCFFRDVIVFLLYFLFSLNWVCLRAYLFELFSLIPSVEEVELTLLPTLLEFINESENVSRLFKLIEVFVNCLFLSLTLFISILSTLCYATFDNLKFQGRLRFIKFLFIFYRVKSLLY